MSRINTRHQLFYVVMAVAAVATFASIVYFGSQGHLWVFVAPMVISPLSMLIIRVTLEYGKPSGLFYTSTQSWAFLFGDLLLLPTTLAVAAFGWQSADISDNRFFGSFVWVAAAVIVGIAVAYLWHNLLEVPAYTASGNAELLDSPSKLWHDYVVYPALVGGIFYLLFPLVFLQFRWAGALALIPIVLWGVLGVTHDAHLNPRNLHPPESETRLSRN